MNVGKELMRVHEKDLTVVHLDKALVAEGMERVVQAMLLDLAESQREDEKTRQRFKDKLWY